MADTENKLVKLKHLKAVKDYVAGLIQSLTSTVSGHTRSIQTISGKVATNENDISGVKTRMTTAEGNISSQGSRITTLENRPSATVDAASIRTALGYTPANSTDVTTLQTGKQDTISDLSTIRSGAAAGATAVQNVVTALGYTPADDEDVSEIKSDIVTLQNTGSSAVAAGKVWTSTATGAEWADAAGGTGDVTKSYVDTELAKKQNTLVSGTSIKTVGGQSLLGSGDIPVSSGGRKLW